MGEEYLEVGRRFIDAAGFWASPTFTATAVVIALATIVSLMIGAVTV